MALHCRVQLHVEFDNKYDLLNALSFILQERNTMIFVKCIHVPVFGHHLIVFFMFVYLQTKLWSMMASPSALNAKLG